MPETAIPTENTRQQLRLRFGKTADLRWISHRDLLRLFERAFRRAGLPLRMSRGFHPKPKLSFPSALALGMEGWNEVMEFELDQRLEVGELEQRLRRIVPHGLTIVRIEEIAPGDRRAQVTGMEYRFAVPSDRRTVVQQAVEQLRNGTLPLQLGNSRKPVAEARADLEWIDGQQASVDFRIRASRQATVRPRDVLATLGLDELLERGHILVRTHVELAQPSQDTTGALSRDPHNRHTRIPGRPSLGPTLGSDQPETRPRGGQIQALRGKPSEPEPQKVKTNP